MRLIVTLASIVTLSILGCSRDTRGTNGPPASSIPPRRACTVDADCAMSCAYGAVSKAWQAENIKQECTGGCEQGHVARCTSGECLAFADGKLDDGCSRDAPGAPKKGM